MQGDISALEKAAKYICTMLDGQCPMAQENIPCPTECTTQTIPWQCWVRYFSIPPPRPAGSNSGKRHPS